MTDDSWQMSEGKEIIWGQLSEIVKKMTDDSCQMTERKKSGN
jgi:hypothetical protein